MIYTMATDGSTIYRNPGIMRIGGVILDKDEKLVTMFFDKLKRGTNSVAEYKALHRGLVEAYNSGIKQIRCYVDSQLVYNQLTGAYKIKCRHLKPLAIQVKAQMAKFDYCELRWSSRETPICTVADAVSKEHVFHKGESLWQMELVAQQKLGQPKKSSSTLDTGEQKLRLAN